MCFFGNCLMEMWLRKELYYHKPEVKACLQTFKRQYDQALRKSERSTHDSKDDTHWIKVNALNTVYSFMFEEKFQGVEVFYAKDYMQNMFGNSLETWNSI